MGDTREVNDLIVDVHCHLFNAADLPIEGFVRHVQLHNGWMADRLGSIAKKLTAGAPTHDEDKMRIAKVIERHLSGGPEAASATTAEQRFDADAESAMNELDDAERQAINEALTDETEDGIEGGPELSPSQVPRYVKWALLFSKSRWDLAERYASYFSIQPALAIPMLVDLDHGVTDNAQTAMVDQVEVFDLLSQASMLGLVPRAPQLRLHPFVGFDPFRQLDHKSTPLGPTPLQVVQDAVLEHGFVGVKLYPEMGWRPSRNTAANAGSSQRAKDLDEILDGFFGWCAANDVPLTAHCNFSNFSNKDWERASLGNPDHWLQVLRDHPDLRVNLGHFGGAHTEDTGYSWTWAIAEAMDEFHDRLFADVSCHRLDDEHARNAHFQVLTTMMNEHPEVADQLMLGTDWYMVAGLPKAEGFIERYYDGYARFGDRRDAFLSGNALRFLGFDRTQADSNAGRLRRRYAALSAPKPSWLVEGDTP